MKNQELRRELDGLHRTLEGAHNRINALLESGGEAKGLRTLCEQLQHRLDNAHNRLDAMSEALNHARTNAELARAQVAEQEQKLQRLIEQLRQEGAGMGHEALKIIERMLQAAASPSSPVAGHSHKPRGVFYGLPRPPRPLT